MKVRHIGVTVDRCPVKLSVSKCREGTGGINEPKTIIEVNDGKKEGTTT